MGVSKKTPKEYVLIVLVFFWTGVVAALIVNVVANNRGSFIVSNSWFWIFLEFIGGYSLLLLGSVLDKQKYSGERKLVNYFGSSLYVLMIINIVLVAVLHKDVPGRTIASILSISPTTTAMPTSAALISPTATAIVASATAAPSTISLTSIPTATSVENTPQSSASISVPPFPPQPSDPTALLAWNYAKNYAKTYVASSFSTGIFNGSAAGSPSCLDLANGDLWSGYTACAGNGDTNQDNSGVHAFVGASARWAIPVGPPNSNDRPLIPLVMVGGNGGMVEAGTEVYRRARPNVPVYHWIWEDNPANPSYCVHGCPNIHPGDEVFVCVYLLDPGYANIIFENVTTGQYTYYHAPIPFADTSSAGVLVGSPPSTGFDQYWPFTPITFEGATLYTNDSNTSSQGRPLGMYALKQVDFQSPLGSCTGTIYNDTFTDRGNKNC